MISAVQDPVQRLLLYSVPWDQYETLLQGFEGHHLRITYDRGTLEIMTISMPHEFWKKLLARLIEMLTFVMHIPIYPGGSLTFRRELMDKGLEPDECYWIQNESTMRGKIEYDIETDPPPDLALEIDITRSSLNRMDIYASLRVPEVWRFDGETLFVHLLGTNGKYKVKDQSRVFPFLPMNELVRFLKEGRAQDQTSLMHSFSEWVRDTLVPASQKSAKGSKKNGKR